MKTGGAVNPVNTVSIIIFLLGAAMMVGAIFIYERRDDTAFANANKAIGDLKGEINATKSAVEKVTEAHNGLEPILNKTAEDISALKAEDQKIEAAMKDATKFPRVVQIKVDVPPIKVEPVQISIIKSKTKSVKPTDDKNLPRGNGKPLGNGSKALLRDSSEQANSL